MNAQQAASSQHQRVDGGADVCFGDQNSVVPKSGNRKRTQGEQLRPQKKFQKTQPDELNRQHTVSGCGPSHRLCDACDDFVKWVSRHSKNAWKSRSDTSFTHKYLRDISISATTCSLCRVLELALMKYPPPVPVSSPLNLDIREGGLDVKGMLASIWLRTGSQIYPGWHPRLAVHIDTAATYNIEGISRLTPTRNKPSPEAYHIVNMWLLNCVNNHQHCKETVGGQFIDERYMALLPKRILDVGETDDQYVYLRDASGKRGHYCALSHCWGSKQPLLTTTENLDGHFAGISLEKLPKTFRDAVEITRGIGIRYLWIDSLCIIQGDKKDWHDQAENMGMIYTYAYLTIAASSAKDSSEGCFFRENAEVPEVQLPYYSEEEVIGRFFISPHKNYNYMSNPYYGPLRKRAWALQEWYLSRRTLHCTKRGLTWKCRCAFLDERNAHKSTEGRDADWDQLLFTYSENQLTYASDRLIALRGMINAVGQTRTDRNHFGMWTADMPECLLWTVSRTEDEARHMEGMREVPSWSWASKDGRKWFWRIASSQRREDHKDWMHKSMVRAIRPPVDDHKCLTIDGFLFSCHITKVTKSIWDHGEKLSSPEMRLATVTTTDSIGIWGLMDDVAGSQLIGIVGMDNDFEARNTEVRQCSDLYYAYMVAGERDEDDKFLTRSFIAGLRCDHVDTDREGIPFCYQCEPLGTPKDKEFYWVLVLESLCEGGNRFRRVGMGVVWPEPSGVTQTFHIE